MVARTVAPLLLLLMIAFTANSECGTLLVLVMYQTETTRQGIKNEQELREHLEVVQREILRRIEIKRALVADLIAGRTTLAAVAEQFLVLNRAYPEYMVVIRSAYPGGTDEEKIVSNVMGYVTCELRDSPAEQRADVLARLNGELECLNCIASETN